MTNSALLKYTIEKRGLTQSKLAEMLDMSYATLNNKIQNKREFTTNEMSKIQTILGMTLEEKEAIFFAKKGDEINTN